MVVPDCISSVSIQTVRSGLQVTLEKQQTSYLFGKENIHQAMVKKTNKTKPKRTEKPIWQKYKVTFLTEVGKFITERSMMGHI